MVQFGLQKRREEEIHLYQNEGQEHQALNHSWWSRQSYSNHLGKSNGPRKGLRLKNIAANGQVDWNCTTGDNGENERGRSLKSRGNNHRFKSKTMI